MEDIFGGLALGGEVLDVGIDRGDRSDGGSGKCGGDRGFHISDHLRMIISFGFSLCLRGLTFICAVSLFVTFETESFPYALSMISWGKLF